MACTEIHG